MNTTPEENFASPNPENSAAESGLPASSSPFDCPAPSTEALSTAPPPQPELFQNWEQPLPHPPARIPHFGHLALLASFALFGLLLTSVAVFSALHFHLFGIASRAQAVLDIRYNLGSEAILYLTMLAASALFFPLLWGRGFFAGLQWNGATAFRIRHRLFLAAILCFFFALLSTALMPGPKDAPIDKIFRSPGGPWLLFVFGITFAPFFEELLFRGFLLPAFCTAYDWACERIRHAQPPPLGPNNHPQWSMAAMIAGSILTSLPFAAMHAAQTGYAWGPFLLLAGVSLVLCAVRLRTRSLASSVLVHASYNFLLFSLMLLGTAGFHNLDKL